MKSHSERELKVIGPANASTCGHHVFKDFYAQATPIRPPVVLPRGKPMMYADYLAMTASDAPSDAPSPADPETANDERRDD
jgi:hypothetical protein